MATITQELFSLDKTKPNILIDFEYAKETTVDGLKQYMTGKVITAQKSAIVQARGAKVGEIIDTRPRTKVDGEVYTFSEVKREVTPEMVEGGAIIVKNPDGEEYIIANEEKFNKKYEKVDGGYKAIDGPKHFIEVGEDICFDKWGEKQFAPKGSFLCIEDPTDVYSITNEAFYGTYKEVDKNQEQEGPELER